MLTTAYNLLSSKFYPIAYNYWVVLGLDRFLVIFWLISFALTASEAEQYNQLWVYDCFDRLIRRQGCSHETSSFTSRNILRVTAAFGAFEL
jgi:hypothetical protein